jgi:NADH:ubiquinone oxidoreductase subunit F (NADH-binding)
MEKFRTKQIYIYVKAQYFDKTAIMSHALNSGRKTEQIVK